MLFRFLHLHLLYISIEPFIRTLLWFDRSLRIEKERSLIAHAVKTAQLAQKVQKNIDKTGSVYSPPSKHYISYQTEYHNIVFGQRLLIIRVQPIILVLSTPMNLIPGTTIYSISNCSGLN